MYKIMIVDDSPEMLMLLEGELEDDYSVSTLESANNIVEHLKDLEQAPNLILLDVNMPGVDGYEACEKIKQVNEFSEIEIIFLSGNDSTEEIIRGLDVGAADYITKPYDPDVLRSKIRQVEVSQKKRKQLKEQADSASKLIHTVMSESGSMGNIITFLRSSFSIKNPESLMSATIDALRQFDLNAIVDFKSDSMHLHESTTGKTTELELELLARLHGHSEPFLEKGQRLFIIHKFIVVLIKNMPEDFEKRGSLKDHLKILLEGANAQLSHLAELKVSSNQRIQLIQETILEAKNALDNINQQQESHKRHSMAILDDMARSVENSFFSMGLTDAQEQEIMDILSAAISRSLDHFESGLVFDEQIKKVVLDLSRAASKSIT